MPGSGWHHLGASGTGCAVSQESCHSNAMTTGTCVSFRSQEEDRFLPCFKLLELERSKLRSAQPSRQEPWTARSSTATAAWPLESASPGSRGDRAELDVTAKHPCLIKPEVLEVSAASKPGLTPPAKSPEGWFCAYKHYLPPCPYQSQLYPGPHKHRLKTQGIGSQHPGEWNSITASSSGRSPGGSCTAV